MVTLEDIVKKTISDDLTIGDYSRLHTHCLHDSNQRILEYDRLSYMYDDNKKCYISLYYYLDKDLHKLILWDYVRNIEESFMETAERSSRLVDHIRKHKEDSIPSYRKMAQRGFDKYE